MADYIIAGNGTTATGVDNSDAHLPTSGATVTVITTVLGWMSPGQTIEFVGNLSIASRIIVNKTSITLDFIQATLAVTATTAAFDVQASYVTILSGHWIGTSTIQTAIRILSASNCVVDGGEFEQFYSGATAGQGVIFGAYGSSYATVQNCVIHGNTGNYAICLINVGYNTVAACAVYNNAAGIFVGDGCEKNEIFVCDFYSSARSHFIYLDGGSSNKGENTVHDCDFHDQGASAGGAVQIKCPRNKVYTNKFYNYPSNVGISIWSQYSTSYANDNEVYDNTFTNMNYGIVVGHGSNCLSPTLRNKIHDNTFTNVNLVVVLNPAGWDSGPSTQHVDDTWIYYNKFVSCGDIFPTTNSVYSLIANTVIAYNDFGGTVTNLSIETYVNTMVYGNTGMADFNVPSPLPIPPPAITPTVSISTTTSTNIYVGQSVAFTASTVGGTAPYTITWYPLGGTGTPKTIVFPDAGTYLVYAVATDSNNQTSPNSNVIQVTVIAPSEPQLYVTVTAKPATIQVGGTSTVTVHIADNLGNNVQNVAIVLTSSGGTLSQTSGITDSSGNFVTYFIDPFSETVNINATASATGYISGQGTTAITVVSTSLATITGMVKKTNGTPIAGANVSLDGTITATSQADGSYTFENIEAKVYQMTVTAFGYQIWTYSVDATAGSTVTQDVVLITTTPITPNWIIPVAIGVGLLAVGVLVVAKKKGG
jgi:hypothetical protein